MEGTRDTEIAMGAYQPHYTWANMLSAPRGQAATHPDSINHISSYRALFPRNLTSPCGCVQIYGYRMSLWAEHIGGLEGSFERPESLECVQRVRGIGEKNWRRFVSDEVSEMTGHLIKYPVGVDWNGRVAPLPGCAAFPDVGGNICGSFSHIQENLTI
jgi:phospholipase D1/2